MILINSKRRKQRKSKRKRKPSQIQRKPISKIHIKRGTPQDQDH